MASANDTHQDNNAVLLEELQLIQCSLLPDELLVFSEEAAEPWRRLLEQFSWGSFEGHAQGEDGDMPPPLGFQIRLEGLDVWFDLVYNAGGGGTPEVAAKENVNREEQLRLGELVKQGWGEFEGTEYPTYQLITTHLLPALHDLQDSRLTIAPPEHSKSSSESKEEEMLHHALFTSHHLVSPTKRRNLQAWSSSLSLTGFAKVGYPGVIYAVGKKDDVEEFVGNVKGMQWLALRLRFLEQLPQELHEGEGKNGKTDWREMEKVGEVVQEMRRLGREEYVTGLGIGTVS